MRRPALAPAACGASASWPWPGSWPRRSSAGRATPTCRGSSCGPTGGSGSPSSPPSSGPAWSWLDPFTTVHDAGAALLRRAGVRGWTPAPYPARLGRWPAVAGFAFFVWLELVVTGGGGGRMLVAALARLRLVTLLGMAQYGRDAWRANGEVFTAWFGLLGRIAPFALAGPPEAGAVRRRPFGAGLLEPGWTTRRWSWSRSGSPRSSTTGSRRPRPGSTSSGCPASPAGRSRSASSWSPPRPRPGRGPPGRLAADRAGAGIAAVGAGLVPIATGYIAGHYLTSLLVDGQRIVIAVSDPFQQGWDLFGTAFFGRRPRSWRPAPCGPRSSPWSSAATCSARSRATWRRCRAGRRG